MAGRPKQRKVLAALRARAAADLGEIATELDYAENWLRNGGTVLNLATDLQTQLGESVSRSFLSNTLNGLDDNATERLKAARREGSYALIEDAMAIADNATAYDIQKAKLASDIRRWMAEKYNRAEFGEKAPVVQLSFGALHLEALRLRAVEDIEPLPGPAPVRVIAATVEPAVASSESMQ